MNTPTVVPRPGSFKALSGSFKIPAKLTISADPFAADVATFFATATGATVVAAGSIAIAASKDKTFGDEGYTIDVQSDRILITAATAAGAFYAVQSLIQLIDTKVDDAIGCMTITDNPVYRWRGIMLDCGRHFWSVDFIKRTIDLIAKLKFNTFHWHLTEDQGWRIEIRKYPRLTEIGAWRDDGHGGKYGGFYTQEQIRDVLAYAAQRHVTVVPEIEMPGHATAAIASYPEYSCTGIAPKVATTWGVFDDVYCPGKDKTFDFIFDVLTEVLALFPGPFVHVGGDECPKTRWKKCPDCQARIKANKLKDEHELQSWFIGRVDRWLSDKGRRLIGWDEILEGGLAPCAAVMSWRGTQGGIEAAKLDHDVVMTPGSHCYLDHYQSLSPDQPKAIGGFTPIDKVYTFEPAVPELTPAQAAHVLGGQGNVWTEYMPTEAQVDYMIWPRAAALAEALWTPKPSRDYTDFAARLPALLAKLKSQGVKYFVDPHPGSALVGEWTPATSSTTPQSHEYDLTGPIHSAAFASAKAVAVQFVYTGGRHRLDVHFAALLEDGTEIVRDTRAGNSEPVGGTGKTGRYMLALPGPIKPAAKYVLKAEIQTDGGTDSAGRVIVWPV